MQRVIILLMTNPTGFAPTFFTIHSKRRLFTACFINKEIGKSVRNESTEAKTAVEACPTAYTGTPSGEIGSWQKANLFNIQSFFAVRAFLTFPYSPRSRIIYRVGVPSRPNTALI